MAGAAGDMQCIRDDVRAAILFQNRAAEIVADNVNVTIRQQTAIQLEVGGKSQEARLDEHSRGSIGSAGLQIG